jgi:putative methyltransferase (TIGR04325 family)
VSVLDWGGALGHYAVIAQALFPSVTFDYSCRELPRMVQLGQRLNPAVHWFDSDGCLDRTYDLVMVNGSLQYIQDWREFLSRATAAVGTGQYFLLTRVPVVSGAGFVALQRVHGTTVLHQQINEGELLARMRDAGLQLVRELVVGDRPVILNAPEQCELKGWLFTRSAE